MKYDFISVAFRTSLSVKECLEIISARTIEGEEKAGGFIKLEHPPAEENRRIVRILRGDRIKLWSPQPPRTDMSFRRRGELITYFEGRLQSSSEGTLISGRMKVPDLGYVVSAVLLLGLGAFALLWPLSLIVRLASEGIPEHIPSVTRELKRFFIFVGPLLAASLWLAFVWYLSRNQRTDIYIFFQEELKAKRVVQN